MTRVVVIDNSVFFTEFLGEQLTAAGYEVDRFNAALDALAFLSGEPQRVDLAIIDVIMPGLDGPGLCKALAQRLGDAMPPVVLITGALGRSDVLHELPGVRAIVQKGPLEAFGEELLSVARRVLAGQPVGRSRRYAQQLKPREITAELLELLASHRRSLSLLDEGLVEFGAGRQIVACNRAACQLLGLEERAVLGVELSELLSEIGDKAAAAIGRLLAPSTGGTRRSSLRVGRRHLLAACTYLRAEEPVSGLLTVKDQTAVVELNRRLRGYSKTLEAKVTERTREVAEAYKRLQESQRLMVQTEKLATLGVLTAGIAHEINNPLAFLDVNLAFVQEQLKPGGACAPPPSETAQEVLDSISECRSGVERIGKIVQDLRELTRTEPERTAPVDLAEAIHFAVRMASKNVQRVARLEVEVGELPPVMGDSRAFRQALLALLINAADAFEGQRRPEHRVRLTAQVLDDHVRIAIEDNAGGIDPDILPRVFDPYFTTRESRAGLGLSITQAELRRHQATLEIEQSSPEGTRVVARFPTQEAKRSHGHARPSARPRVMFVDDEEPFLRAIARHFRERWDVLTITRGAAALERLREGERFDAVVCDLLMPQMDGAELARRACGLDPTLRGRILFLTGGDLATDGPLEIVTEFDNLVLHKPIDLDFLGELVEEAMQRSRGDPRRSD